jgi:fructokinase
MKRGRTVAIDALCFGEILWDMFEVRGRRGVVFDRQLGGAPANVATGLARLGVRAAVAGAVGRDVLGDALAEHLENDGVDTRFVEHLPNRTGVTFVTRDAHGEPRFLFYRRETADMAMTEAHVDAWLARGARSATWLLVGTSTLVVPALARATWRLVERMRAAGASIHVDLNVRAHLWASRATMQRAIAKLVARADLVKASDADLAALGATTAPRGEAWLARHAPRASWLLTYGARGAAAIGAHGEVRAASRRVRCVDATGAGDAFIAGSLAALVAARARPGNAAWRDAEVWTSALRVGHIVGAKAVTRVGAVAGLRDLSGALRDLNRKKSSR